MLEALKGKRIHIIGISGAEGSALAAFLPKNVKADYVLHDFCREQDFKKSFFAYHDAYSEDEKEKLFHEISELPYPKKFSDEYLSEINENDIIFVPQSWFRYTFNSPLKKYRENLMNIIQVYLELAKCPVVGVTGTLGKSTTAALVSEIAKQAGKNVVSSGNERHVKQLLEKVSGLKKDDLLVLEISNRQLKFDLKKSPHVAVITNIFPNHLDDHESFEEYIKTKENIVLHQHEGDFLVTNADFEVTREIKTAGKKLYFSNKQPLESGAMIKDRNLIIRKDQRDYVICQLHDLALKGEHNLANILAASLATFFLGINTKEIRKTLMNFETLDSRMEIVEEVNGITFINDSKSCNPAATIAALETFKKPVILIAGGSRKKIFEGEFLKLAEMIIEKKTKGIILIGETANEIEKAIRKKQKELSGSTGIIRKHQDFKKAFSDAVSIAEKGDIVLFSPGCESFGMFQDYRERAQTFIDLVKNCEKK